MNNKKVARVIALVLAFLMLFSVIMIAIDAVTASARVTQSEINRLREQQREYERRRREIQSRINAVEFERRSEVAKKSVLDDRIVLTGMEIENILETIDLYEQLILEKEDEVLEAQAREDEQLQKYRTRVRNMEEDGVISYLEIVFHSSSFSDLLARLDFVSNIMRADELVYYNLIAAKEETEAAEAALRATKVELEEEHVRLEEKEAELLEQLEEANAIIALLESELETERALRAEMQAEEDKVQREINAKVEELRRQEERDRQAALNSVRGTGELVWPVPGHRSVTSGFGIRLHPVFRVHRQHNGIDIGAPNGANVVAADSGRVITSDYNSSYGHFIVISHGTINGVTRTTLYAHLSSRGVRAGANVTQGQVIGRIGSTGISTGPHLHFEVRLDGGHVDPIGYLTR
jgi:murein DD-endopeptidase MepM/ murein hydrolase activator NlpD